VEFQLFLKVNSLRDYSLQWEGSGLNVAFTRLLWPLVTDVTLSLCSYYNKQWSEAQRMIADLSQLDVSPEEAKPEQVDLTCSHLIHFIPLVLLCHQCRHFLCLLVHNSGMKTHLFSCLWAAMNA